AQRPGHRERELGPTAPPHEARARHQQHRERDRQRPAALGAEQAVAAQPQHRQRHHEGRVGGGDQEVPRRRGEPRGGPRSGRGGGGHDLRLRGRSGPPRRTRSSSSQGRRTRPVGPQEHGGMEGLLDAAGPLGLVLLALVDSTSMGTLVIPVILLVVGEGRALRVAGRTLLYLLVIGVVYLLPGIALLAGPLPLLERFGHPPAGPAVVTVLALCGGGLVV